VSGTDSPLISVVIPCYNAERTLLRTLASVRAQTWRPIEIIAVDDASRDGTLALLRGQEGDGVRVIAEPRNGGAPSARNAAIAVARGEFLAFIDADDEWYPQKLERQFRLIADHPAMTMVGCRCEVMRPNGERVPVNPHRVPPAGTDAWRTLLHHSFFVPSTVMARTETVRRIGAFDARLRAGEDDQDICIRLALEGEVGFVDAVLATMHELPDSLSRIHISREHETVLPMILAHCERLAPRLSRAEQRAILGARHMQIGRNVYLTSPRVGFRLLLTAIGYGTEPAANAWYLLSASPWSRRMKRLLRGRQTAPHTAQT
jgi:glycosyltransferase involved in cell wall biosynthesis